MLPPSLKIKSPIETERGKAIANRASRQFLDERLRIANYKIRQLEEERKWTELGLRRTLAKEDLEKVERVNREQAERTFCRIREKQCKKFDRFVCRRDAKGRYQQPEANDDAADQSRWVINKSSRVLTRDEMIALQKGLNFSQRSKTLPTTDIIAGVEPALRKCENQESAERARVSIASIIRKHRPHPPNTTPEEREAFRNLKKEAEITILPADKGNATVILNTEEYIKKANQLLDNSPFKKVKQTP